MPTHQVSYTLDDGEKVHREHPDTYEIPPAKFRNNLEPGDGAKLVFRIKHYGKVDVERMWVIVTEKHPDYYVGTLENQPYCTKRIKKGTKVKFEPRHIIDIVQSQR